MQFKGQTALVTGASAGIGASFAVKLADLGCDLILTARRRERLESLASEITSNHGVKATVLACDLSDPAAAGSLCQEIDGFGIPVDILINNAGFGYKGILAEANPDTIHDMVQVNVAALTMLMQHFLPGMIRRGHGGIVNVASMAAIRPVPTLAVYAATKAYVLSLSEAVWQEVRGTGVHVSALCPGPVETEFFEVSGYKLKGLERFRVQTPDVVVEAGIRALIKNQPFAPTGLPLKILSVVQKIVPRKLGLYLVARNMNR